MRASSVGVTDIHTPSVYFSASTHDPEVKKIPVVLIALPANDVSKRWFNAKLFPTDCWPMDDTTFTGYA
jgi:hypothetical protein